MSFLQRIFLAVLPKSWGDSAEADSRAWKISCSCGHARSVWDMGGIRWKAAGEPRKYMKCSKCGERSWHQVTFEPHEPQIFEK